MYLQLFIELKRYFVKFSSIILTEVYCFPRFSVISKGVAICALCNWCVVSMVLYACWHVNNQQQILFIIICKYIVISECNTLSLCFVYRFSAEICFQLQLANRQICFKLMMHACVNSWTNRLWVGHQQFNINDIW